MSLTLTRMVAGTTATAAAINLWADGIEATDARVDTAINPPRLHVYRAGAFSAVASNTLVLVTWDTEQVDSNSVFTASTSHIPAPTTGRFEFNVGVGFPAITAGNDLRIMVRVNAASSTGGGGQVGLFGGSTGGISQSLAASKDMLLTAGDYLEVWFAQGAATTPAMQPGLENTWARLIKIADT